VIENSAGEPVKLQLFEEFRLEPGLLSISRRPEPQRAKVIPMQHAAARNGTSHLTRKTLYCLTCSGPFPLQLPKQLLKSDLRHSKAVNLLHRPAKGKPATPTLTGSLAVAINLKFWKQFDKNVFTFNKLKATALRSAAYTVMLSSNS